MTLHPQAQAIVDAANAAGVPFEAGDYRAIRDGYRATTSQYRHPTPPLDSIANLMAPGPGGNLALRFYRPRTGSGGRALPALVYFHGGGWVVGDLDTHDHLCRYLAGRAGAVVIAVDYRLAPEHPFPAAYDDAVAATRWLLAHAAELALDPERFAVGGDSAGGNLAAAVALAVRDEIPLRLQALLYPAVDLAADNASLRDNGRGYLLTSAAMKEFIDWYLPPGIAPTDWRVSPFHAADHRGVAPALIVTAGYDPLRDEAIAYASKLEQAGVPVEHRHYADMIHGFARMGGRLDTGLAVLDHTAIAVANILAP